jgi:hypothetical protein
LERQRKIRTAQAKIQIQYLQNENNSSKLGLNGEGLGRNAMDDGSSPTLEARISDETQDVEF